MRRPIIAGNWKMNKTPSETMQLIEELKPRVQNAQAEVVVCPPNVSLFAARAAIGDADIALGAQNVHFEDHGAFTGEVTCDMLLELGVKYVILGHSERRQYFHETDEDVNRKTLKVLEKGLLPIICVGENLHEKEQNVTAEVVRSQVKKALQGVLPTDIEKIVIAYEPVWAIGTGLTPTSREANNTIREIRAAVGEMFPGREEDIRIQYGGSMNPDNAASLMGMSDIDGGLIGGASLDAKAFSRIVHY